MSVRSPSLLVLLATLSASAVEAQTTWSDRSTGKGSFGIEVLKPFFKEEGSGFATGAGFLSASARLGGRARLELELPIAVGSFDDPVGSTVAIGNPYLGIRLASPGGSVTGLFGVRAPLVGEPDDAATAGALGAGIVADIDRFHGFAAQAATVRTGVEFSRVAAGGLLVGARLGGSLLVNTGDNADKAELYVDYGARVGFENAKIMAAVGVGGLLLATESDLSLTERTLHNLVGQVEGRSGRIRPSATVRVLLDDEMRSVASVVVGLGVRVVW